MEERKHEDRVGVDDPSNNRLGSSVAERPACDGVVPGSIPVWPLPTNRRVRKWGRMDISTWW